MLKQQCIGYLLYTAFYISDICMLMMYYVLRFVTFHSLFPIRFFCSKFNYVGILKPPPHCCKIGSVVYCMYYVPVVPYTI